MRRAAMASVVEELKQLFDRQQLFLQQMADQNWQSLVMLAQQPTIEKQSRNPDDSASLVSVHGGMTKQSDRAGSDVVSNDDGCAEHHPLADAHQVFDESPKSNPGISSHGWVGEGQGKSPVGFYNAIDEHVDGLDPSNGLGKQHGKGQPSPDENSGLYVLEESGEEADSDMCLDVELLMLVENSKALGLSSLFEAQAAAMPEKKNINLLACWISKIPKWKAANGFYSFVFDPGKLGVGQSTPQPKPLAFMYARMVEILATSKVSVVFFVFDPGEERVTTVFSSDPGKLVSWHTSAQVIAVVAGVKVPREEWPDRIGSLLNNSSASLKQTTLDALGDVSMTVILARSAQNGHVDQVDRGMEIFESMCKVRPIDPRMEHYACVVNMLGRARLFSEAKAFVDQLPMKPGIFVWQALLGACASHGDSVLGHYAAAQLLLLAPENPAPYVQLANIFSAEGKWRDRAMAIKRMKEVGLAKETGISWIEIEKELVDEGYKPGKTGKIDVLRSIKDASGWSGAGQRKVMEGRFYARPVAEQAQRAVTDVDELGFLAVEPGPLSQKKVSPANHDMATFDALKLIREVDPSSDRAFGVLTKLALMDKGTNVLDVLEGRAYILQHPWVGIVNRSQAAINRNVDMMAARRKERESSSPSHDYSHLPSRMGSEYFARIPSITSLINTIIDELEGCLGRPVGVDAGAQLYTILELCCASDNVFKEHLNGERPDGARIYGIFDNQLPAALRKLPFDRYLSLQSVTKTVSEADGYQPHLFAPELGCRRLLECTAWLAVTMVAFTLLNVRLIFDPGGIIIAACLRSWTQQTASQLRKPADVFLWRNKKISASVFQRFVAAVNCGQSTEDAVRHAAEKLETKSLCYTGC